MTGAPDGVLARREVFGLFGAVGVGFVLAACGGSKAPPVKAVSDSSDTGSSDVRSASASTATTSANDAAVAAIGGAHVASNQALSAAGARRLASEANGHWQGGWLDSAGSSGTSDVTIAIDSSSRKARTELSFGGPLLGSSVPAQTYEVDLLSFVLSAGSFQVPSPQFGEVTIEPGGATTATASTAAIPGHPELKSMQVSASRVAHRVDLVYTLSYADGHTVKGTMAFALGGARAQPRPLPKPGAAPNPVDIASGAYAATLLTAGQVSTIMGSAFAAPQPNGGRLFYDTGIDVSNALSTGKDEIVYWAVHLGRTAADMTAFWKKEQSGFPNIDGPWKAAFWLSSVQSLYVHATDTRGLLVQVTQKAGAPSPTAARRAQFQNLSEKIARQLVLGLGH